MNEPIQVLHSCLALGLFWAFWQYGWKKYALDSFRQSLFCIRADLFELAACDGRLPFGGKSYVALRDTLNTRLRFAHKLSFTKIVVFLFASLIPGLGLYQTMKSYKTRSESAIEAESDLDIKQKLCVLNQRSMIAFLRYLLLTSPLFFTVVFLTSFAVIISSLFQKAFWKVVKQRVTKELSQAGQVADLQAETCDEIEQTSIFCPA